MSNRNFNPLVVTHADQLRTPEFKRLLRGKRPLLLALGGLPQDRAAAAAAKLNDLRAECGCGIAAVCAVATLVAALAWLASRYGFGLSALLRLPLAVLAAVIAGGAAKALRLLVVRREIHREVDRLVAGLPGARAGT